MNDDAPSDSGHKGLYVASLLSVTVIFAAFISGVRETSSHLSRPRVSAPPASAPKAPGYLDMRSERRGANARMYDHAFEDLVAGLPKPSDPVKQSEADKARALSVRSARRAYDGAPPMVPHAAETFEPLSCAVCHEHGARIGTRIAPKMSHANYSNCVQCHAVVSDPKPVSSGSPRAMPSNSFVGMQSPTVGERAWPGAPPTIPHTTHMRTECMSCHGVSGASGLRSTHPDRTQCVQCHAPSAILDQRVTRGALSPSGQ